eukprot:211776-Alexandrium_andersonii.AAC.1
MKCYECTDARLALAVFEALHLDSGICRALRGQWTQQIRWPTFGGALSASPIEGTTGLPQGDPWAPLALCVI